MISKGQRYKTKTTIPVIAMTYWAAPFTGGYERELDPGIEFTISHDPVETATAVYCDPVDYRKLHRELIPFRDRLQFWLYRGYYLCIQIRDIEKNCELLSE